GPCGEVLAEDLGERLHVLGRSGQRSQMLSKTLIAALDDRRGGSSEAEREGGDVGGGRTGRGPGRSAAVARHPLPGESCLAVSGGGDEHPDTRLRLVEERE